MVEDNLAQIATGILEFRRARSKHLAPNIFAEPAWELLLELFIADAEGHRLTGRTISAKHDVPTAIISRYLILLTDLGLIVGDGIGNLDDPLTLSGAAMDGMESLLTNAKDEISLHHEKSSRTG